MGTLGEIQSLRYVWVWRRATRSRQYSIASAAASGGNSVWIENAASDNVTYPMRCSSPGPISSITVLGAPIMILNDAETATELLVKRSARYSSRPRLIFASEMLVVHFSALVPQLTI